MRDLEPATELAAAASKLFPNDSAAYRAARTALLAERLGWGAAGRGDNRPSKLDDPTG